MPTLVAVADYTFILSRVIKWLGVGDANYPEGTNVAANSPYTQKTIRQQIIQSDLEVAALIASALDSPFRNSYFTQPAVAVNSGEKIPSYLGVHGKILANKLLEDGTGTTDAHLAQSLDHLQRVRDKYNISSYSIPESSKYLYYIDNSRLELVAALSATIELPYLPFDLTAVNPTLLSPQALANAVIAHAVFTTLPVGADIGHRTGWGTVWTGYVQMILGGAFSLPEPERLARIAS